MKYLSTFSVLLLAGMLLTGPVLAGGQLAALSVTTGKWHLPQQAEAGEKYLGTDDLVDRKMQEVAGVSAGEPLIDLDQGNLGMFVFVAGGFAAGTVFGYYWRKIFGEKAGKRG
jgi:cobalt/nickel transport system permease protein/cobalt/nickel transport protein